MSNGEEFIQQLFEKKIVSSIIIWHPGSKTKTMMKRKGKARVKGHVEKPIKKKPKSKVKES
jgi:hypothetical protein